MSGLHVVQCLCHGQVFWGQVSQSTGNVALQVRRRRIFHLHLTHSLAHKPLDPSISHLEFLQHLARPSTLPFDSLDTQTQGLATTPDNHLPQLTGLPSSPSPMSIPTLPHPVPIHMSMTTQTFSPSTNPMVMQPPTSVCDCGFCRLPEVPQRPYQSTQISVGSGSRIGEMVTFSKGGCGIPLRDAIENRLSGLVGGDDIMFDGFNVSAFSLRIEVCPAFRSSW